MNCRVILAKSLYRVLLKIILDGTLYLVHIRLAVTLTMVCKKTITKLSNVCFNYFLGCILECRLIFLILILHWNNRSQLIRYSPNHDPVPHSGLRTGWREDDKGNPALTSGSLYSSGKVEIDEISM